MINPGDHMGHTLGLETIRSLAARRPILAGLALRGSLIFRLIDIFVLRLMNALGKLSSRVLGLPGRPSCGLRP
jgi:hypothetical protein